MKDQDTKEQDTVRKNVLSKYDEGIKNGGQGVIYHRSSPPLSQIAQTLSKKSSSSSPELPSPASSMTSSTMKLDIAAGTTD